MRGQTQAPWQMYHDISTATVTVHRADIIRIPREGSRVTAMGDTRIGTVP